jgi:hypothetical protein
MIKLALEGIPNIEMNVMFCTYIMVCYVLYILPVYLKEHPVCWQVWCAVETAAVTTPAPTL